VTPADGRATPVVEVQFDAKGKVEAAFLQEVSGPEWHFIPVNENSHTRMRRWLGF
jgi:hypothetical protein